MGNEISWTMSHFRNPAKQRLLHLIPVTAVRGAAGTAHRPEQRQRERQEDEIRRPHREEWRHEKPVAQFLAPDQAAIIEREYGETGDTCVPDLTAREASRERHTVLR